MDNVCGTIGGNVHGAAVRGLMFLRKCLRRYTKGLLFQGLMFWEVCQGLCYRAMFREHIRGGGDIQLYNNVYRYETESTQIINLIVKD